jgi:hypothetical protein
MTTDTTNTLPSLAEIAAAKRAAEVNAEGWVEGFGRPYDDEDDGIERITNGEAMDDIHVDTIAEALGLGEENGHMLSDEVLLRVWPVYRAALVLRVYELLAAESAAESGAFADARAALAEIAARHALPADARELGAALRERDGDRAATDREEAASLVWGWLADDRVIIVVGEVVDGYLGLGA